MARWALLGPVPELVLPLSDSHQKRVGRRRRERYLHWTCSRQERTCFRNPGAGIGLFGSCWFVVAVSADAVGDPEPAGGFTMMTGIEAMPEPIVVERVTVAPVVVSATPVEKLIAA